MNTVIKNSVVRRVLAAALALVLAGQVTAQTFKTLYSFTASSTNVLAVYTNTDGTGPQAALVFSGNTLFGTTYSGGRLGNGTVFALKTDGTGFTNLFSFTRVSDGAGPNALLVVSGNTLYGTASEGGSSGSGTVFKLVLVLSTKGSDAQTRLFTITLGDTRIREWDSLSGSYKEDVATLSPTNAAGLQTSDIEFDGKFFYSVRGGFPFINKFDSTGVYLSSVPLLASGKLLSQPQNRRRHRRFVLLHLYPTPLESFIPLLEYIPRGAPVWEPAAGDFRLVKAMREHGLEADGADLVPDGYDFLKDDRRHFCIVTNPPFSLAFEFCQHAVSHSDHIFLLLRLNFLGSQKRERWFSQHEPDALFILSKRPSFVNGRTDATEYAWYYWGPMWDRTHHL
jgi:hypothetical protein